MIKKKVASINGKGGAGFQKKKERGAREREGEREVDPNLTRVLDPAPVADSGHLTGRAWYRSKACEMPVTSLLSSPLKTDWNASVWSSKSRGSTRFCRRRSLRIFSHSTAWILFLNSHSSLFDRPQPPGTLSWPRTTTKKLMDFGASIYYRCLVWKVTAGTVGRTEV